MLLFLFQMTFMGWNRGEQVLANEIGSESRPGSKETLVDSLDEGVGGWTAGGGMEKSSEVTWALMILEDDIGSGVGAGTR